MGSASFAPWNAPDRRVCPTYTAAGQVVRSEGGAALNRTEPNEPTVVVSRFLEAFSAADFGAMGTVLDDDLVAYITDGDGEVDRLQGRDAYLGRIEAMDLRSAQFSVTPTQAPVSVAPDQVLVMVEIHAHREGRSLHNFAAHLLRVADGRITEWRMVDAKPAESEEFWS